MFKECKISNFPEPQFECYEGIKDYFGNKCFIVINKYLGEIKIMGKNEEYKKKVNLYTQNKWKVIPQRYLEVIDFSKKQIKEIKECFSKYKIPLYKYNIW